MSTDIVENNNPLIEMIQVNYSDKILNCPIHPEQKIGSIPCYSCEYDKMPRCSIHPHQKINCYSCEYYKRMNY